MRRFVYKNGRDGFGFYAPDGAPVNVAPFADAVTTWMRQGLVPDAVPLVARVRIGGETYFVSLPPDDRTFQCAAMSAAEARAFADDPIGVAASLFGHAFARDVLAARHERRTSPDAPALVRADGLPSYLAWADGLMCARYASAGHAYLSVLPRNCPAGVSPETRFAIGQGEPAAPPHLDRWFPPAGADETPPPQTPPPPPPAPPPTPESASRAAPPAQVPLAQPPPPPGKPTTPPALPPEPIAITQLPTGLLDQIDDLEKRLGDAEAWRRGSLAAWIVAVVGCLAVGFFATRGPRVTPADITALRADAESARSAATAAATTATSAAAAATLASAAAGNASRTAASAAVSATSMADRADRAAAAATTSRVAAQTAAAGATTAATRAQGAANELSERLKQQQNSTTKTAEIVAAIAALGEAMKQSAAATEAAKAAAKRADEAANAANAATRPTNPPANPPNNSPPADSPPANLRPTESRPARTKYGAPH